MRKLIFAVAATAALAASGMLMSGIAEAAVTGPSHAMRAAADDLNTMQDVQFRHEGRRHCWAGRGWGGGEGWNGWRH